MYAVDSPLIQKPSVSGYTSSSWKSTDADGKPRAASTARGRPWNDDSRLFLSTIFNGTTRREVAFEISSDVLKPTNSASTGTSNVAFHVAPGASSTGHSRSGDPFR